MFWWPVVFFATLYGAGEGSDDVMLMEEKEKKGKSAEKHASAPFFHTTNETIGWMCRISLYACKNGRQM